jgi:hypothetical protein
MSDSSTDRDLPTAALIGSTLATAYQLRLDGADWKLIATMLTGSNHTSMSQHHTRRYADQNGLPWPVSYPDEMNARQYRETLPMAIRFGRAAFWLRHHSLDPARVFRVIRRDLDRWCRAQEVPSYTDERAARVLLLCCELYAQHNGLPWCPPTIDDLINATTYPDALNPDEAIP